MEKLRNGHTVSFYDLSNRYYGDFHRVRIVVRCSVRLTAELFGDRADDEELLRRARDVFGSEAVYEQSLERMGVAGEALEETKRKMIESFIHHTFPYLERPDFASSFVRRELNREGKPLRSLRLHR